MTFYYVSIKAQANGDHEVHRSTCVLMPTKENIKYLGSFDDCFAAVREAKKYFPQANGCYICSNECHTK